MTVSASVFRKSYSRGDSGSLEVKNLKKGQVSNFSKAVKLDLKMQLSTSAFQKMFFQGHLGSLKGKISISKIV